MRIVKGKLAGRHLTPPADQRVRPTAEATRDGLLTLLGDEVRGARVLDLCAGTGALGFEALSRGARHVHFNEPNPRLADALAVTAQRLKVADRISLTRADARTLAVEPPCDIVFIDPPYALDLWPALFARLPGLLAEEGWVYVEWPQGKRPQWPAGYQPRREARAGVVECALLEPAEPSASVVTDAAIDARSSP